MPEVSFSKVDLPWGFLGNMAPYPITHGDQTWLTSEALFQALRFNDPSIREEIRAQKSPMAAKMIAKKHKASMVVTPMSKEDIANMRYVLKLKFDTHPAIKAKLLNSAPHIIIEDIGTRNGERHFFWGMKKSKGVWTGTNTMGQLLMDLRNFYLFLPPPPPNSNP